MLAVFWNCIGNSCLQKNVKTHFHPCKGWTISCISVLIIINFFFISPILRHRVQCFHAIPQEILSLIPGLLLSQALLKVQLVISTVLKFLKAWFYKENWMVFSVYKREIEDIEGSFFFPLKHTHRLARHPISVSWEIMHKSEQQHTGEPHCFPPKLTKYLDVCGRKTPGIRKLIQHVISLFKWWYDHKSINPLQIYRSFLAHKNCSVLLLRRMVEAQWIKFVFQHANLIKWAKNKIPIVKTVKKKKRERKTITFFSSCSFSQ